MYLCTLREHVSSQQYICSNRILQHHGSKSKIIGNKLNYVEFLEEISGCDIVGLSELVIEKVISLPGFKFLKQKIREKIHRGPKIVGGLSVFAKEHIAHLTQVMPNKTEDSIWVKLKKDLCGEREDIFIGTFYVSPHNNLSTSLIMK